MTLKHYMNSTFMKIYNRNVQVSDAETILNQVQDGTGCYAQFA